MTCTPHLRQQMFSMGGFLNTDQKRLLGALPAVWSQGVLLQYNELQKIHILSFR